jgi:hypothetical protein
MSVFLNSTPQEDGELLNGSVEMVGTTLPYSVVAFRDAPNYLHFFAGGQFVGIWDSYYTYLETGDTGFTFRWKIWARGSGDLDLTQDTDPTWTLGSLPATSIGTVTVNSVDWELYHQPAGTIDLDDFLDFDAIRLGLDLTSGEIDINTIQLECVPDSGTTGWWANQASFDVEDNWATAHAVADQTAPVVQADTEQDAWDDAYDAALADNPISETDPTVLGIDNLGDQIGNGVSDWARVSPTLVPVGYSGEIVWGVFKLWVDATPPPPSPQGDEAVDYIRVPGYTAYDENAYTRRASNRSLPPATFVSWQNPHVIYGMTTSFTQGRYDEIGLSIGFSLVEEEPHPNDAPIDWSARGSGDHLIDVDSLTTEVASVSLPSAGTFAVYGWALSVDGGSLTKPVLPDPAELVGLYMAGSIRFASTDDPDAPDLRLYYDEHYEAFSQWDPFATPPGGKLKVWLPSSEWRIIGDVSGSDTERLKVQTPDLTWWKEYRSSDGAVTTHPLKVYTADGWVVAADMTPD